MILTCEIINNLDALVEMLKELTINDAVYHCSDENDAVDDPASNTKVDTHTSD